jgi:hypothetical protein
MCLRLVIDMVQYMVQPCAIIQARSDSDFGVKCSTVQFYVIEHNSKSNCWIELKLYAFGSVLYVGQFIPQW